MKQIGQKDSIFTFKAGQEGFTIFDGTKLCPIVLADSDFTGVKRVAGYIAEDLYALCGKKADILVQEKTSPLAGPCILAGTLGHSHIIDELVQKKKISVDILKAKAESFIIDVVKAPFEAVPQALVVIGSSKRGTIFGLYELSTKMGVSPWHWFADVPAPKREAIVFKPGPWYSGEASVRYRGFFINDEYPCLGEHVHKKFGGFTHSFYEKVFDLLLRLKGNYFWPAMWNECFHDDDGENTRLADELGVIMGTSHHEPLMRAWKEWGRYGKGPWNLEENRDVITKFWTESVERQKGYEALFTVGMRGDGDEALSDESRDEVLYDILNTQRGILEKVYGKPAKDIPQLWAVYKEVQDYYEQGAKIPEDILVMLCDDNWGNIRKIPRLDDYKREGGYGLYYHFDYVGGPRNYKWINTNPLPRVRQQLELAYHTGIDRLWIVNVGDIKPLEFPLSFFLDYAWDIHAWDENSLKEYAKDWAVQQFGKDLAEIGEIIDEYSYINGRRKPELQSPATYSIINFKEAEQLLEQWRSLIERTNQIKERIPQQLKDSFFQLVEYPVLASANLAFLHISTAKNWLYAKQGRAMAYIEADKVRQALAKDFELRRIYHEDIANGKWIHMMDQNHISYTYWQQPEKDVLPKLKDPLYISHTSEAFPIGLAVEGSETWWPGLHGDETAEIVLPEFCGNSQEGVWVDIWQIADRTLNIEISVLAPWLKVDKPAFVLDGEERVWLSLNTDTIPSLGAQKHNTRIQISCNKEAVYSITALWKPLDYSEARGSQVFAENQGYVAIEADNFASSKEGAGLQWRRMPGLGKTSAGVSPYIDGLPIGNIENMARTRELLANSYLEYQVLLAEPGLKRVELDISPDNNFLHDAGLRIGLSIGEGEKIIANIHTGEFSGGQGAVDTNWDNAVADNIRRIYFDVEVKQAGLNHIRVWFVDPGLVLQRVILWSEPPSQNCSGPPHQSYSGPPHQSYSGPPRQSYLGPPESKRAKN